MPRVGKTHSYMTNKEYKKITKQKEDCQKAKEARAQEEKRLREEQLCEWQEEPIELKLRNGNEGGHHCSYMDGPGKSHRTSPDCFRNHHMGACKLCRYSVSAIKGCKKCGQSGSELQYDNIKFPKKMQAKILQQVDRRRGLLPLGHEKKKNLEADDAL